MKLCQSAELWQSFNDLFRIFDENLNPGYENPIEKEVDLIGHSFPV
jgi:hypothetical protein